MKKIIIFGAKGRLGSEALRAFHRASWTVVAVVRKHSDMSHLSPDIEVRYADAMIESEVVAAAKGADFILNALNPPYTEWARLCIPMLKNVLKAAHMHKATHLFIGNVYNFGEAMPDLLERDTAQVAETRKGKVRIEMESLIKTASEQESVQSLIIRAGDFFGGKGLGSSFDLVIARSLKKNIVTYPGPLDRVHAWAYLPDLAKAFVKVAQEKDSFSLFEVFNFEGHAITGEEMVGALNRSMGKTLTTKGMPWGLIKVVGWVHPMFREIYEMAYLWKRPHRLKGDALFGEKEYRSDLDLAVRDALCDIGHL